MRIGQRLLCFATRLVTVSQFRLSPTHSMELTWELVCVYSFVCRKFTGVCNRVVSGDFLFAFTWTLEVVV